MSRSFISILLLTAGALAACAPSVTLGARGCADPLEIAGGEPAEVIGNVHRQQVWGPPNFGEDPEHDARVTLWMIDLPGHWHAADPADATKTVALSMLQVLRDPTDRRIVDIATLDGRQVRVRGKLWRASSAGDQTPVVLAPDFIETTREEAKFACEALKAAD